MFIIFVGTQCQGVRDDCYKLDIYPTNMTVKIYGNTCTGIYYGIQSLLSLIATPSERIPQTTFVDSPRFPYRGLMVDVARNFQNHETIMKLIKVMGMYKLNKLHLHLTDSEGWRLEIPELKELTEVNE